MTAHPLSIEPEAPPSGPFHSLTGEAPVAEVNSFGSNPRTFVAGGIVSASGIDQSPSDGGLLETLRSPSGASANPFNATDKHLVEIGGMQTPVATAIRMGYLARHPATGALIDTGRASQDHVSPSREEQSQPQQQEAPAVPMTKAGATINDALFSNVPPSVMTKAVNEAVTLGYVNERTIGSIATNLQVEPATAAALLERLGEERKSQRNAVLNRLGVDDPEEFEAFLKEKRPDLLREATAAHLGRGDASGYERLTDLYFQNLDQIAPERILSADLGSGITARWDGKQVILDVPGKGQMAYRSAVRAGIISVSRR